MASNRHSRRTKQRDMGEEFCSLADIGPNEISDDMVGVLNALVHYKVKHQTDRKITRFSTDNDDVEEKRLVHIYVTDDVEVIEALSRAAKPFFADVEEEQVSGL